jgi:hypothetical protein
MTLRRIAARLSNLGYLVTLLACVLLPKRRSALVWGTTPLPNNIYWSAALKKAGWQSVTLMSHHYSVSRREDFDIYFQDLVPDWLRGLGLDGFLGRCLALLYLFRNARVVHMPFRGGVLAETPLWRIEARLLRLSGIRLVLLPYGGDAYMYSRIIDPCLRQVLLTDYPQLARVEQETIERVQFWSRHADCILCGFQIDGMPRWDVVMPSFLAIDTARWKIKRHHSMGDGVTGVVKVLHTPNHRAFKGSEFLLDAVRELRETGLKIELVLLEGVPNEVVRERMQECDILVEQLIASGYALSCLEGMASGLPVLSNLEHEAYTRLFRRYSFLDECPVVSTTPESVRRNLEALVRQPLLRRTLGLAGRAYMEKYHSYEMAQYLFGSIYRRILFNEEIDLASLFHPLKSDFNRRLPRIEHPLVENRLPQNYMARCSAD